MRALCMILSSAMRCGEPEDGGQGGELKTHGENGIAGCVEAPWVERRIEETKAHARQMGC